jgi:hypothetical protein
MTVLGHAHGAPPASFCRIADRLHAVIPAVFSPESRDAPGWIPANGHGQVATTKDETLDFVHQLSHRPSSTKFFA